MLTDDVLATAELRRLKETMDRHAAAQQYEEAACIRNQIKRLRAELLANSGLLESVAQLREAPPLPLAAAALGPRRQFNRSLEALLLRCPLTTTSQDVLAVFPNASRVDVAHKRSALWALVRMEFPTSEEAFAAGCRRTVVVSGAAVVVRWAGGPVPTRGDEAKRRREDRALKVTVRRCPPTTTEEDLRHAFPTCDGAALQLTNGRFKGVATVFFATPAAALEATRQSVVIGGANLKLEIRGGPRLQPEQGVSPGVPSPGSTLPDAGAPGAVDGTAGDTAVVSPPKGKKRRKADRSVTPKAPK